MPEDAEEKQFYQHKSDCGIVMMLTVWVLIIAVCSVELTD